MDLTLIYKKGMQVTDTWYPKRGIGTINTVAKTQIRVDFDLKDTIYLYDIYHIQFLKIKENKMTEFNDCRTCKHNMKCEIKDIPKTCLEFEEIKKDLNFQVGDKAYDLMFGNALVIIDEDGSNPDAICVKFTNKSIAWYSKEGKIENISGEVDLEFIYENTKRTLFHGHDLEVKIEEKEPIRYKWVNIIFDPNVNKSWTGDNHNSKEEAFKNVSNESEEHCFYINTIQLIPNHLKEK